MGNWEVVATILGVVTIITGGVVRIFGKTKPAGLPPAEPPASLPPAAPGIHEIDKRLALIEQRVESMLSDIASVKQMISQAHDKTEKLSEIIIEWLQSGE